MKKIIKKYTIKLGLWLISFYNTKSLHYRYVMDSEAAKNSKNIEAAIHMASNELGRYLLKNNYIKVNIRDSATSDAKEITFTIADIYNIQ